MSTGMQAPGSKLEKLYPSLGSNVTAVSRSDECVDEAGFKASLVGQACGSGRGNASVRPMNTSPVPVPTLYSSLVSH